VDNIVLAGIFGTVAKKTLSYLQSFEMLNSRHILMGRALHFPSSAGRKQQYQLSKQCSKWKFNSQHTSAS